MRSVKIFAITFALSLIVLGILAYNIIGNAFNMKFSVPAIDDSTVASGDKNNETSTPDGSNTDTTDEVETDVIVDKVDPPVTSGEEITMLFVTTDYQPSLFDYTKGGYDEDGLYIAKRKVKAEALILLKIDSGNETNVLSVIPGNTVMNKNTSKTVGELYSEKGSSYMIDCVYALTGVQAEYVTVIGVDDSLASLSKIGNVMFDVPFNMVYKNEDLKLDIDIKSGLQSLSPQQAYEMLRFDAYTEEYAQTRTTVLLDFTKTLIEKLTAPAYKNKSDSLYDSTFELFETTFDRNAYKDHLDLIFSYSAFKTNVITYPGYEKQDKGKTVFVPTIGEALSAYEEFN